MIYVCFTERPADRVRNIHAPRGTLDGGGI
jgi:hypothetical protein